MTEQTKAERLADELDGIALADMTESLADDAAAELRRLHAVNQELLEAAKLALSIIGFGKEHDAIRAAIARAEDK
jgi:hypothetical protein